MPGDLHISRSHRICIRRRRYRQGLNSYLLYVFPAVEPSGTRGTIAVSVPQMTAALKVYLHTQRGCQSLHYALVSSTNFAEQVVGGDGGR